ncbi:hypothetical protein SeMB42_g07490 [Synchytrium endobioticum]|uniref:Uncharacterized protein n=1 Tax=Synchytrium endobioticum TaxID=286115 RepID=A0A507C212_9FUNG|nr:hypothetical protein SeMB42_g07490 [Synchytrium endobioticum]
MDAAKGKHAWTMFRHGPTLRTCGTRRRASWLISPSIHPSMWRPNQTSIEVEVCERANKKTTRNNKRHTGSSAIPQTDRAYSYIDI